MKNITILLFLFLSMGIYAQETSKSPKSEPKDSITVLDIQKHKYMLSVDINQYNLECYRDSIDIREFLNKPLGGDFWKTRGQYYWNIFDPLPNVKYLHRRMTAEGLLEFLTTKYGQK